MPACRLLRMSSIVIVILCMLLFVLVIVGNRLDLSRETLSPLPLTTHISAVLYLSHIKRSCTLLCNQLLPYSASMRFNNLDVKKVHSM